MIRVENGLHWAERSVSLRSAFAARSVPYEFCFIKPSHPQPPDINAWLVFGRRVDNLRTFRIDHSPLSLEAFKRISGYKSSHLVPPLLLHLLGWSVSDQLHRSFKVTRKG